METSSRLSPPGGYMAPILNVDVATLQSALFSCKYKLEILTMELEKGVSSGKPLEPHYLVNYIKDVLNLIGDAVNVAEKEQLLREL